MNIKSITPNLTSLDTVNKTDAREKVRFQESADRDANGRQEREDQPRENPNFTDEQWNEAVGKIKKLPAVLKNHLQVEAFFEGERRFVKITNSEGEVIRRLTESDVWESLKTIDLEEPKGQLLNKAM